jgi:dihydroorotase (multifunctional complex type)
MPVVEARHLHDGAIAVTRTRFDLAVVNGRLVLPGGEVLEGSVAVRGGRIAALAGRAVELDADEVIDAGGHLVLPGIIDLHVHFRDPGLTHKEDFASGSRAAAKGGVTTVGDMPNTRPPTTTARRFADKCKDVASKAHVDHVLWGGVSGPDEIEGFATEGATGVKVFLTKFERRQATEWTGAESPHSPELFVEDDAVLLDIFAEAARVGLPVAVHLGNQQLLRRRLFRWDGKPFAEIRQELLRKGDLGTVESAQRCALLARASGAHLHFVHVPPSVLPVAAQAKREGTRLTVESFCPFMSTELMDQLGPLGYNRYMAPDEIEAVWQALRDGTIDNIGTDHAPHTLEEKKRGFEDILSCPSGYPEVETSLPMMFDAMLAGRLTLARLVELMASEPARIARIQDRKGAIAIGRDADLVILDPAREWTITSEALETKSKWTPFAGRRVRGWPRMTILRGTVIMRDGAVVGEPGFGRLLRPLTTDGGPR